MSQPFELTPESARKIVTNLPKEKIGNDLYNLLQTYTDNDTEEEDKNQVKAKIEKLVSTRKDLIDILMIVDPNGVLKLQNGLEYEFRSCIAYLTETKRIADMEKRIMLVKEFESDNQLITFLRSDLSLSLGFLGRILTRVEEKHAHYKLVVYYTNHNNGQLSLRVYKKKILEQLDEDYNERHFVTNDRSVETITQAAGKTIYQLMNVDINSIAAYRATKKM